MDSLPGSDAANDGRRPTQTGVASHPSRRRMLHRPSMLPSASGSGSAWAVMKTRRDPARAPCSGGPRLAVDGLLRTVNLAQQLLNPGALGDGAIEPKVQIRRPTELQARCQLASKERRRAANLRDGGLGFLLVPEDAHVDSRYAQVGRRFNPGDADHAMEAGIAGFAGEQVRQLIADLVVEPLHAAGCRHRISPFGFSLRGRDQPPTVSLVNAWMTSPS